MSQPDQITYVVPRAPALRTVGWAEVGLALKRGFADFRRAPAIGLAFGALIAAGGILSIATLTVFEAGWLAILIAVVFPLIFPFITAGLYEISKRLAAGQKVSWGTIASAIWNQRERQVGWMAFVVLFVFWVWIYQVRILLAIFMGSGASANIERFLTQTVTTSGGWSFLAVGTIVGLVLALVLFSATVLSLPLLYDTELDFVTGIIVSFQFVTRNLAVMLGLGVVLTVATVLAVLPAFLGFIIVVPIFGHATWHLYTLATERAADARPAA